MPIFELQHPDGRTFEVDAPDMKAAAEAVGGQQAAPQEAAPEAPVTAGGLGRAIDSGAASAISGIVGLPRAAADAIQAGGNWASNKLGYGNIISSEPSQFPTAEDISKRIQDAHYGGAAPYEPQNRAERYAKTGGEFLLNAAMPGGLLRRAGQVVVPAAASEATKEAGGGALAQAGASLLGGAGVAKAANVAERLGTTALPSIEKGVAGNLRDVAQGQYNAIEKDALKVTTSALDRSKISIGIESQLHSQNFRRANAPKTYEVLDEVKAGNPGQTSDFGDLLNARRKLGNISGEDGVAALQARDIIAHLLDYKIPGTLAKLETADKNWSALKVSEVLSAKFQKAADQTGATHSGLNLGNKLRQEAAQLVNTPSRTKYMNPEDVAKLRALAKGTPTQNITRWAGGLLGGGGGLGALLASGAGAGYAANHPTEGAAGAVLAGLALRHGYNRSIARQAGGIGQGVLARSPQAGILGSSYTPPMTLGGALGAGLPSGALGILGR